MSPEKCRVAVAGAGIAGLVTARELVRAGVGSVLVLEARDRVGGRTVNQPIPGGEIVEGGGEFAGPTQTAVLELAEELGIGTFPTYCEGQTVYLMDGSRWVADDFGVDSALAPGTPGARLDQLALEVPRDRPWDAPRAAEWDAMTVADWLKAESVAPQQGLLIELSTAATLGAAPADLSLLWFLFYIRSAGGLHDLLSTRGGAQDRRFIGGSQMISLRLAEELGDRLRLSAPVRRISAWANGPALIECDGTSIEAERVVISMMPLDVNRIAFDPPLPKRRALLNQRWSGAENSYKAQLVYETAFWRADGLSGQVLSDEEPQIVFDNSPPSGTPGVLLSFVDLHTQPKSAAVRRDWLAGRLARYFGDAAKSPIAYVECDWHEDGWTAGCVSPLRPGVISALGPALTEPCGAIHWAGTETAAIWNGYMDGAVRSGRRAAAEIVAALNGAAQNAAVLA
jgi:monoamine oxidase